jgi:hypothetical protein
MAQKVSVVLMDDLDGTEASETIAYALDGVSYEIDLNDKNAAKIRKALDPFIAASRKASKTPKNAGRVRKPTNGDAKDVRAWAKTMGHQVPDRGRIPLTVLEAYRAAH